jgi:gamma-glutamylcyclotransferase (GGCT)/AIG2-like uncharacterized protein YtfP
MKIFLYGTLTDPAGFGFCAGRPLRADTAILPAILPHYRRVLLRGARYPTLRRARGHAVHGVIMRVNADMLMRLQNYESDRYRRVKLRVQTHLGPQYAICFMGDAATAKDWHHPAHNKIMTLRSRSF